MPCTDPPLRKDFCLRQWQCWQPLWALPQRQTDDSLKVMYTPGPRPFGEAISVAQHPAPLAEAVGLASQLDFSLSQSCFRPLPSRGVDFKGTP